MKFHHAESANAEWDNGALQMAQQAEIAAGSTNNGKNDDDCRHVVPGAATGAAPDRRAALNKGGLLNS
eukprot:scaffold201_cov121-Isochrysis_galbana.AAC.14